MCRALQVSQAKEAEPCIQHVRDQGRSPRELVKCQVNTDRVCGMKEDCVSDCRADGDQE